MNTSIFTSLTEQEFKDLVKSAVREIFREKNDSSRPAYPETLDIKEAANFLKLKIATLYEKTSRKLIPHFKKGNKLYFHREELIEWIKNGKVQTHEEIESKAATFLLTKNTKPHNN
jgi:excisionase family DNA binding protein